MRLLIAAIMTLPAVALADPPVIEDVYLEGAQIHVTVRHNDSGWDHYADVWRVYAPDGRLFAERILAHPHETEQPFTRSTPFTLSDGITALTIIAGCTNGDLSEPFAWTGGN